MLIYLQMSQTTTYNISPSMMEWFKTVPDYQYQNMILQATEVNNDEIELRCLETNLHIAKKWARQAVHHISKVLNTTQFSSAFTDSDFVATNHLAVEAWNPPPPPTINYLPDPKNARK
jgi:hypothetical protein